MLLPHHLNLLLFRLRHTLAGYTVLLLGLRCYVSASVAVTSTANEKAGCSRLDDKELAVRRSCAATYRN